MSRRFIPATASANGTALQTGDVVTGGFVVRGGVQIAAATVNQVVAQNGLIKVAYEFANSGLCQLYRWHNDQWNRCLSSTDGDWFYFAISVGVVADRVIAVSVEPDAVELALVWDSFNLSSYPGGGVLLRTYAGVSTGTLISSTKLTKTIKVVRGREGYYVGQHSQPMVGPQDALGLRNSTDYGERESGTGGGTYVAFSSAGFVSRHPEWGADARWAAAEAAVGAISNRTGWMGIADPSYSIWSNAAVIATQNSGFPNYQTTGPWWAADLPTASACPTPMCRYIAMVQPIETGSWQFGVGQGGILVAHFVNEHRDSRGSLYPYQLFIGAFPYTSPHDITTEAGRANEPTASLRAKVVARCPLAFDDTGEAIDETGVTMDEDGFRDDIQQAIAAITPSSFASAAFVPFRETTSNLGGLGEWANANSTPSAAFRYFAVRILSSASQAQAGGTLTTASCEICVAYPNAYSYGASSASATAIADQTSIGAALAALADITVDPTSTDVTVDNDVTLGLYRFTAEFWTS